MHSSFLTIAALGAACAYAQTAVPAALYASINRYAAFAAASYGAPEDCPTPPFGSVILQNFNGTSTDTQATLFRSTAAKEIILAFRGTSTPRDLDTDFAFTLTPLKLTGTSCGNCSVHQGFQDGYLEIQSAVISRVNQALSSSLNAGYKFIITGHSLGGGLASLAATGFAAAGKKPLVYTFGEPRNGDPAFSTYANSLLPTYYRTTHANDGVPTIPPQILGFKHHGVEIWQKDTTGTVTNANTFNCGGGEPTNCISAQNYGTNPINGAHLTYSNILLASSLYNYGCGYRFPA